ncbi:putative TMV resistance protein N-like [Capsicum annuum]|nr:putative TMV resistance protein N-like [Capsicum annuum]
MKWLWRYNEEGEALWREVIIAKYGEMSPWCTKSTNEPSRVWRTIRNLWPKMKENLFIKVVNGNKTKFWNDVWIDQSPLRELFPDLFQICDNPDVRVGDYWSEQGWDISFRRSVNDWEIERVAELLGKLGSINLNTYSSGKIQWKHNKDGLFSEAPETKRKTIKRTFKSEKEFLEFTLKYQQVLAERDSAIAVRDKLESLCRELQRQNKVLLDECKRVSSEGQNLRLDLSDKFQDAIKGLRVLDDEGSIVLLVTSFSSNVHHLPPADLAS